MKKFLPCILLLISCYSFSQVQLKPSRNIVDPQYIKNNSYTAKIYTVHDTAREEFGTMRVTVQVNKEEDKIYIITETRIEMDGNTPVIDTSIINYTDMSPVSYMSRNPMFTLVINYGKEKITGYYHEAGKKAVKINKKVQGEYFDADSYPTILSWTTALKEGYSADLKLFDYFKHKPASAHLLKVESVKEGNTSVWKLSSEDEVRKGIKVSYYIDPVTRKFLRAERDYAEGKTLIIMD